MDSSPDDGIFLYALGISTINIIIGDVGVKGIVMALASNTVEIPGI